MANSLEQQLITGGVSPAAAKAIANAIGNLSSSQQRASTQLVDGTQSSKLRMINAEDRRSYFTNLDQPADSRFSDRLQAAGQGFEPRNAPHSYDSAEPKTTTPRVNSSSIVGGPYINVETSVKSEVQQSRVSLDLQGSGKHLRLSASRDKIEAVDFGTENETNSRIENEFVERGGKTVLRSKAKGLNTQDVLLADGTSAPCAGWFNATPPLAQIFSAFVKNNVLNATNALDFANGFIQYGTFRPYYSVDYSSSATPPVLPYETYEVQDPATGGIYDGRSGYYIRIGDFVQCWGRIQTRTNSLQTGNPLYVPSSWYSLNPAFSAIGHTRLSLRGFPFKYKHTTYSTGNSVNQILYTGQASYVFNFYTSATTEWLNGLYMVPNMAGSSTDQSATLVNAYMTANSQSINPTPNYAIHSGIGVLANQIRQTDFGFNVAYSTQDLDQYA